MTRTTLALASAALVLFAGCDQELTTADTVLDTGIDTSADPSADVLADTSADTPADSTGCSCDVSQGCVLVTVTRQADTSMQPWVVWPADADGTGTLIVSATRESTTLARETVTGASYVAAGASNTVELCVTPGAVEVRAFFDDDLDASPDATYSADYLDSCLGENDGCFRCVNTTVAAGGTVSVSADLVGSCD